MTDTRTSQVRRRIMQSVGTQNTGPEMLVRRLLHKLGYRYRIHGKALSGSPDIVFSSKQKVIFVHGCYWHGHDCPKGRLPKSRTEYWVPKIAKNKERDRRNVAELEALGWAVLSVWQCETKDVSALQKRLEDFLSPNKKFDRFFGEPELDSKRRKSI